MPNTTTIASYVGVFLLIITLVAVGYQPPKQTVGSVANAAELNSISTSNDQPSVDQIVAASVAGGIAERANLPVAPNIAELSVSLSAKNDLAQADDSAIITKPQIVQAGAGNRDVKTYIAKAGDTVDSVAAQYSITGVTLKWANNLTSDALEPGRELSIPPVDGVVYTVKAGDTVDSLAQKYSVDKDRIISFNDLEIDGLSNGKRILLPGAALPETERPGYVAPRAAVGPSSEAGYRVNSSVARASAGNRYAPGNCTWYAYERRAQLGRPVGSFWGNGGSWGVSGRAAGFTVNGSPEAGALFVQVGSPGHVGVVESVNAGVSITVSEMNNYAYGGFNIVNSRTIPWGSALGLTYVH